MCLVYLTKATSVNLEVIWTNLNLHMSESFRVKLIWRILAECFSRKKKIQGPHQSFAFLWLSPLWRGTGPIFVKFWNPFTQRWFVPCLIEIGLEDMFFNINTCNYGQLWFSCYGPSRPPGTLIWRNFNLHYVRKLSCKYDLF